MTTFKELGLNKHLMQSLDELGFENPSPIQEKSIPFILNNKSDLIALAQTGTGKTAAFSLPILNQIKSRGRDIQAIVLCPTRELCLQISQDIKKYAKYEKEVSVAPVYGGERIDIQIRALKNGANIVVGTPGRVHDLIRRKALKLQAIKWLVLDEADEMLDMGFKDDLDAILDQTPEKRQTLLFSATISKSVLKISKEYMSEVEEISIGTKNIGADKVSHEYYVVGPRDRFEALQRILDSLPGVYGILFCRTRRETQEVADKLKQANYNAEPLHGEITQSMRTKIMGRFKKKQISLLVATDVAARGIDVNDLTHVLNYNLPDQNEAYTHRSGRTGRAQKSGVAITIVTPREVSVIRRIEDIIGKKFELKKIPDGKEVCQKQIDNYIEEIASVDIEKIGQEKYFDEIVNKLKKITKEDLIKHFLAHKFNHLMANYKHSHDLNAKGREPRERKEDIDGVGLKINFGKKQGMDIKELFGLLNANKGSKGVEVGRINSLSDCILFTVEKGAADRVVRSLKGTMFRGKKIDVCRSGGSIPARSSYPRKRRGGKGSNTGYQGRKKRYGGKSK